jgi:hypothetical protein
VLRRILRHIFLNLTRIILMGFGWLFVDLNQRLRALMFRGGKRNHFRGFDLVLGG